MTGGDKVVGRIAGFLVMGVTLSCPAGSLARDGRARARGAAPGRGLLGLVGGDAREGAARAVRLGAGRVVTDQGTTS